MKRLLSLLCFLTIMLGANAGDQTTDYVYATELQYDNEFELYYFDVVLQGENIYTGYGMDIQLPQGMEVMDDGETIYAMMNEDANVYPQNKVTKKFSHFIGPSFPYPDDHSHLRVGCMSSTNADLKATSGTLFRVYVDIKYTSAIWPVGAIKTYAVELNKVGAPAEAFDKETIVALHTGATTLPFNISAANKWSTCILPFSAAIPEGVKAYTCTSNDEQYVYLTEVESMEAYKPYVLYSENGYSGTITGTVAESGYPETSVVSNGYLCGAIAPQTATKGYIMQKQNDAVKFYAIDENDSFTIPAGKCWLNIPESTNAKALSFFIEDISTGVSKVTTASSSAPYYDLLGRQQINMKQRVIIKNGKKILK